MGTRADFYIGKGPKSQWIGSIAYEGHVENFLALSGFRHEEDFRRFISKLIQQREDGTLPEQGWPWPWEDSTTTDVAYTFDDGRVWFVQNRAWLILDDPISEDETGLPDAVFPNMKHRQNVATDERSGILFLTRT